MDPVWYPAVFGLLGAACAAAWSYLMAKYVAGPRAKELMVGTLKGTTGRDREIVGEIREQLIRPELLEATRIMKAEVAGVSSKLEGIRLPDAPDLVGLRADLVSEIKKAVSSIQFPELALDTSALEERLMERFSATINAHKAVERRQLMQALNKNVDGFVGELEALTDQQIEAMVLENPSLVIAKHLTTDHLSAKYRKASPVAAAIYDIGKAGLAQMAAPYLQQGAPGAPHGHSVRDAATGYVRGLVDR